MPGGSWGDPRVGSPGAGSRSRHLWQARSAQGAARPRPGLPRPRCHPWGALTSGPLAAVACAALAQNGLAAPRHLAPAVSLHLYLLLASFPPALSPVFPIKFSAPPPPAMWLVCHPFPKLFLSRQLKHFPLLDWDPPTSIAQPSLPLSLKISPSVLSGASVSMYCSRRGLLEPQQGLQHAYPSSEGPQPTVFLY